MAIALNIPSQIEKYLSLALFPATGNDFTLYIANDTNRLYQWDGAAYVEVSQQDAVNWGSIGGDILNQTDLQLALAGKEPTIAAGTTSQYFRGDKTFQTLDKSAVGLGNVDNTSDANKPISTATQTALNAKQDSLGYTPVPETRTLTINGTTQDLSANRTFTISTGITIGTTLITSGTVGRVLFEGTGNVVQESANLFWDNTNGRFGIGTAAPQSPLHVIGSATSGFDAIRFKGQYSETGYLATSNGAVYFASGAGVTGSFLELSSAVANLRGGTTAVTFTVGSERMRINNTGNVLIKTTIDAGFTFDVNGTARVVGQATIQTLTVGLGAGARSNNTVLGLSALSNNTTGNFNVAIGPSSLNGNTTGTGNIGIGHFSAVQISTGVNNVALGREALSNGNSTGNVAIGFQACNTATGTNNVVIGLQSQAGNFNGSIVLGINAAATASNQFVVGSSTTNAGTVTSEVNASTQVWNVIINGVARKILLA